MIHLLVLVVVLLVTVILHLLPVSKVLIVTVAPAGITVAGNSSRWFERSQLPALDCVGSLFRNHDSWRISVSCCRCCCFRCCRLLHESFPFVFPLCPIKLFERQRIKIVLFACYGQSASHGIRHYRLIATIKTTSPSAPIIMMIKMEANEREERKKGVSCLVSKPLVVIVVL